MKNNLTNLELSVREAEVVKTYISDLRNIERIHNRLAPRKEGDRVVRPLPIEGEELIKFPLINEILALDGAEIESIFSVGGDYKEERDKDDMFFQGDILAIAIRYSSGKTIYLRLSPTMDVNIRPVISPSLMFELSYYEMVVSLEDFNPILKVSSIDIPEVLLDQGRTESNHQLRGIYLENMGLDFFFLTNLKLGNDTKESPYFYTEEELETALHEGRLSKTPLRNESVLEDAKQRVEKFIEGGLENIIDRMLPQVIAATIFGRDTDFRAKNIVLSKDGRASYIDLHQLMRIRDSRVVPGRLSSYDIDYKIEESLDIEVNILFETIVKSVEWLEEQGIINDKLQDELKKIETVKGHIRQKVYQSMLGMGKDLTKREQIAEKLLSKGKTIKFEKFKIFQQKILHLQLYDDDRLLRYFLERSYSLLKLSGSKLKLEQYQAEMGWTVPK